MPYLILGWVERSETYNCQFKKKCKIFSCPSDLLVATSHERSRPGGRSYRRKSCLESPPTRKHILKLTVIGRAERNLTTECQSWFRVRYGVWTIEIQDINYEKPNAKTLH